MSLCNQTCASLQSMHALQGPQAQCTGGGGNGGPTRDACWGRAAATWNQFQAHQSDNQISHSASQATLTCGSSDGVGSPRPISKRTCDVIHRGSHQTIQKGARQMQDGGTELARHTGSSGSVRPCRQHHVELDETQGRTLCSH